MVVFDRKWTINSKEDYDKAIRTLKGDDFDAEMSDDLFVWHREKEEVARQMRDVKAQAQEKGII